MNIFMQKLFLARIRDGHPRMVMMLSNSSQAVGKAQFNILEVPSEKREKIASESGQNPYGRKGPCCRSFLGSPFW